MCFHGSTVNGIASQSVHVFDCYFFKVSTPLHSGVVRWSALASGSGNAQKWPLIIAPRFGTTRCLWSPLMFLLCCLSGCFVSFIGVFLFSNSAPPPPHYLLQYCAATATATQQHKDMGKTRARGDERVRPTQRRKNRAMLMGLHKCGSMHSPALWWRFSHVYVS